MVRGWPSQGRGVCPALLASSLRSPGTPFQILLSWVMSASRVAMEIWGQDWSSGREGPRRMSVHPLLDKNQETQIRVSPRTSRIRIYNPSSCLPS